MTRGWFRIFRPFCLPVKREGGRDTEIFKLIIKNLNQGKRIMFFPEGGRTGKGTEFLYSEKGKRIRKPYEGIGVLAIWSSGAQIVLI